MGIALWIIVGIAVGYAATRLMPGTGPSLLGLMLGLGVTGALLGGFSGIALGLGQVMTIDIRSLMLAASGAIILVFCYRTIASRATA
jgi:uncharacterized membrane protein YeaQ/YmgE (transglycosylase-associated protein family)